MFVKRSLTNYQEDKIIPKHFSIDLVEAYSTTGKTHHTNKWKIRKNMPSSLPSLTYRD